jgi:hypothetical protein
MIYMLIMVVLGGSNLGTGQPMRVAHYHSLAACEAAAADAKSTGFDRGTVGFVCVRVFGDDPASEKRTVSLQAPIPETLPGIHADAKAAAGREGSSKPHDVDTAAAARQAPNTIANLTMKPTATLRPPSSSIHQFRHKSKWRATARNSG